jgi:alkanesulfonate monooxygenase SsuD/methylene tetrahydromethanopterin reductase-like flavin-dependent oxidoreductase (luciferase family)
LGLQVFPIDTPVLRVRHLLAAGRLAKALGFDAVVLEDHPAWGPEPCLHPGALAVATERAVAQLGALIQAGIPYVIVEALDAADQETIRPLAERIVPALSRQAIGL